MWRSSHSISLFVSCFEEGGDGSGWGQHADSAFIHADKEGYDGYYEHCLVLLREGGLIAIGNTLWNGSVAEPAVDDSTEALQALNQELLTDDRVDLSLVPIGGGLTLGRKRETLWPSTHHAHSLLPHRLIKGRSTSGAARRIGAFCSRLYPWLP